MKHFFNFFLIVVFIFAVFACNTSMEPTGGISLSVADTVRALTFEPPLSMATTEYIVNGTDGSDSFGPLTITGTTLTQTGLEAGLWTITIDAKNAAGDIIGDGENTVDVTVGAPVPVTVTILELAGDGTLDSEVTWEPDVIFNPLMVANLLDSSGTPTPITYALDVPSLSATYTGDHARGFYGMTVQIEDSGSLAAGFATVVRIVQSQTTEVDVHLYADQVDGLIDLIIDNQILATLLIDSTVSEGSIEIHTDETISVTVSASDATPIICTWYLDGTSVSTGETFDIVGNDYDTDKNYRLDVIAWDTAGLRAGSAHFTIDKSDLLPEQLQISGTIPSNTGFANKTFYVEALDAGENTIASDSGTISETSATAFSIDLASGDYRLLLWVDENDNGTLGTGEHFAYYSDLAGVETFAEADVITIPDAIGVNYSFSGIFAGAPFEF